MIVCYRCQCQIAKRVRRIVVQNGMVKTYYCRHCAKAEGVI